MSYEHDPEPNPPISRVAIESLYRELSPFYQDRVYEFLEKCLLIQKNELMPIIEVDEPTTMIVRRKPTQIEI